MQVFQGPHEVMSDVIGVVPAAGLASRISPLPCSKELYPLGFRSVENAPNSVRPKTACHYLLEVMRAAGIAQAYIVLREGKWDIPAYFRDGSLVDMALGYLMMGLPFGVPYTLDQAYPFVRHSTVALGFPDIVSQADDPFSQLLSHQVRSGADLVLGLFPADRPDKVDMVDVEDARVRRLFMKPIATALTYTWGLAVWTPVFTQFMHDHVASRKGRAVEQRELFLGDVIQAAIEKDVRVEAAHVSHVPYIDIGSPEDLVRATRCFSAKA
jgi:glucose-1-phosphate thymidylyltransferase